MAQRATKQPGTTLPREEVAARIHQRHADIREHTRDLSDEERESSADRLLADTKTGTARRLSRRPTQAETTGRIYTLDSAYAAVPALAPRRDPEVISREAKEEKAGRTMRELAEG